MILKPQAYDLRLILYFLGKIVLGFAMMMAFPILTAVLFGELVPIVDFAIGLLLSVCAGLGLIAIAALPKDAEMRWMHGMVVVALAWLVCMLLGAVPLYLSGHWNSFLDACFESMSGLATTGLVLVQDLDHLSKAANLWRHLLMFLGGQGIIVVALSFLVKGAAGAFTLYVGEARDEKILPNIIETAKFIWFVSLIYFGLGTVLLTACCVWSVGLPLPLAIFHSACVFMAAFDTGGFTPQSQNIIFYQSALYETISVIVMVWGSINFNLHYAIWTGRRRELVRDIETRTFFITMTVVTVLAFLGLGKVYVCGGPLGMMRRGFFQVISAHTGTGFQTIYGDQFVTEWGPLAILGLVVAMALGVSVCSTTGGIKMLRVGLIGRGFKEDVKRFLTSEASVIKTKFRHLRDLFLDDRQVRSAALVSIAYLILYFFGAVVGCFYGYPFLYSLFESTSAAGNVGLTCGITQSAMPAFLKVVYILQMWAGRLEFISVFVLCGFFVSFFRGK